MILIFGDKKNETINWFTRMLGRSHTVVNIDHRDIVDDMIIQDEVIQHQHRVRWRIFGRTIESSDIELAICNISSFSPEHFKQFVDEDRNFLSQEYSSFLFSAIQSIGKVCNGPRTPSALLHYETLPYQWSLAKGLGFEVPRWQLGVNADLLDNSNRQTLKIRNPYIKNNWSAKSNVSTSLSKISYQIPMQSKAILIHKIYSDFFSSDLEISRTLEEKLTEFTKTMGLDIATFILFGDRSGKVTFGSATPFFNIKNFSPKDRESLFNKFCKNANLETRF